MQEAGQETVLGDFSGTAVQHGSTTTTFFVRDGEFFVNTVGPDGEQDDFRIAYTFGHDPLQQYLIGFPDGRYQAFGLAWDARPVADGGQRWFPLYDEASTNPDDPLHWTAARQTWNNQCADCHSTNLVRGYAPDTDSYATTWSDLDVSCEACHGPGSAHVLVAHQEVDQPSTRPTDWGLLSAPPDPNRVWAFSPGAHTARRAQSPPHTPEIETCASCHSRRSSNVDSITPGTPFLNAYRVSLLDEGLYHPDGQIQDEVYVFGSFVQSKMYAAGVTCSDCHDPHSLNLRADGNALCAGCHLPSAFDRPEHTLHPRGSEGAECVSCHMPATTYMVVDPRRDHSIRVPRPDLSDSLGTPNACNGCHMDQTPSWAAEVLAVAGRSPAPSTREETPDHYGVTFHAARRGDPASIPSLISLAAEQASPAIVRATALTHLARAPTRVAIAQLRQASRDPDPMVRLGALIGFAGSSSPIAVETALDLVGDPSIPVRDEAARILLVAGTTGLGGEQSEIARRALIDYEQRLSANLESAASWANLASIHLHRREIFEAETAYRRALALDPAFIPAVINLADLLRATGRDAEVERVFAQGLRHLPEQPDLHHGLGLLYVRNRDLTAALPRLERAAQLGPGNPRFGYVYGVAIASSGDTLEARRVLEETLTDHPWDSDVLTALVNYARQQGHLADAIGYAERLVELRPSDLELRQLLTSLRSKEGSESE